MMYRSCWISSLTAASNASYASARQLSSQTNHRRSGRGAACANPTAWRPSRARHSLACGRTIAGRAAVIPPMLRTLRSVRPRINPSRCDTGPATRALLEREAHHDRVPELAARPAVLPYPPPFLDETGRAVQRDRGRIVREHLEAELVQPLAARPVNGRPHEPGADPAAAPVAVDKHPDLAEAVAADLDVQHADDPAAADRDDRLRRAAREKRGAVRYVDRRLGRDPGALCRNRRHQLCHRPRVPRLRRPHRELRHRAMLASRVRGEAGLAGRSWWPGGARPRNRLASARLVRSGPAEPRCAASSRPGPGRARSRGRRRASGAAPSAAAAVPRAAA